VGIHRVHYVSTDEVFGPAVSGTQVRHPTNPYSAGKAGGEAAATAWANTYGLYITVTNSANTYGPRQAPEKLIPKLVIRSMLGHRLPIYGDGLQSREWLFVEDHCSAIICVAFRGSPGESYGIGTGELIENLRLARLVLDSLGLPHGLIVHVGDRPGHDRSYSIRTERLRQLGWTPRTAFSHGLSDTVEWYRKNRSWWSWFAESA
jgi:dTDP-glucose 4,6-dehydratase